MIAMTREASMTPSSISFASSLASATEWIGTLRTSMALGMVRPSGLVGYDDGACGTGDGVGDVGQVGDDRPRAALLDEPADRVDLRAHRAAGEVAVRGVTAHLARGHDADVARLRRTPGEHGVGDVGGDHEHVGLDGAGQQG